MKWSYSHITVEDVVFKRKLLLKLTAGKYSWGVRDEIGRIVIEQPQGPLPFLQPI